MMPPDSFIQNRASHFLIISVIDFLSLLSPFSDHLPHLSPQLHSAPPFISATLSQRLFSFPLPFVSTPAPYQTANCRPVTIALPRKYPGTLGATRILYWLRFPRLGHLWSRAQGYRPQRSQAQHPPSHPPSSFLISPHSHHSRTSQIPKSLRAPIAAPWPVGYCCTKLPWLWLLSARR